MGRPASLSQSNLELLLVFLLLRFNRVEPSHWSRSGEILSSDWLSLTMLVKVKVYAKIKYLKARKMPSTWRILCLSLFLYGTIREMVDQECSSLIF